VSAPSGWGLEPAAPVIVAAALLALAFAAREVAAGALRAAGHDLWQWLKRSARR
jgi:hypothetical protein